MTQELIDKMRQAADRPKDWDVPGLLRDAANELKVLAGELIAKTARLKRARELAKEILD